MTESTPSADPTRHWDGQQWLKWNGQEWTPEVFPTHDTVALPPIVDAGHAAPRKGKRRILGAVGALALLVVGIAIGAVGGSSLGTASPSTTVTSVATITQTETSAPLPAVTITAAPTQAVVQPTTQPVTVTDGTWTVGVDIPVGSYKVDANVDPSAGCYWEIDKTGSNGQTIIANNNVSGGRPSVTLKKGEDFTSQSCGTWAKTR
jgi:hypothetical protein